MNWANIHSLDHTPQVPIRILGKALHCGWQEKDPVFFCNLWNWDRTGGCVGAGIVGLPLGGNAGLVMTSLAEVQLSRMCLQHYHELLGKGLHLFIKQSCLGDRVSRNLTSFISTSSNHRSCFWTTIVAIADQGLVLWLWSPRGRVWSPCTALCGSSTLWPSIPSKAWRPEASYLDKMVQVGDLLNPKAHRCLGKHQFHRTVESQSSLMDPQGTS